MFQCAGTARSHPKKRTWAAVSATSPVSVSCSASAAGSAEAPATRARAATVGFLNRSRGVMRTPAARARATSWMETMESPPSSKKLSRTPTRSRRSTSAQTRQSASSTGPRGGS
jgi:hypothetical protein